MTFISTKGSLFLNELKQKFMARWECHDLGETTEFLGIYISHDCKNQKIFIDQCEYLEKVLACFNVATKPTVKDVWSESGVIWSGAELLRNGRDLTTKVGEQPWPQLMHCASIYCHICGCVFQED